MIATNNLCFSYGERCVFDGLSLTILEKITVIEGASGCGKTTLLKLISGLLKPKSGSITGAPNRSAFMFQEDRLLPWLSALQNVTAVMPKGSAEKARKLLSGLELAEYENTLPANLSGGQRRRVAIARALGFDSELLILDEPLKGLDMKLAAKTCELIKAQNKPIIVTSHSSFETSLWGGTVIHM